jgi:DNA-binding transcriptional ArsR family regulator
METRPMMRLSRADYAVLLVCRDNALIGLGSYGIKRRTRLRPGRLAAILARLEAAGLLESAWEGEWARVNIPGQRQRYYRVTREGAREAGEYS